MKQPLLPDDQPWFDPKTGRPTELFAKYMRSIDARILREPVSTTAPTNGQVMVYSTTTGLWTPGAN